MAALFEAGCARATSDYITPKEQSYHVNVINICSSFGHDAVLVFRLGEGSNSAQRGACLLGQNNDDRARPNKNRMVSNGVSKSTRIFNKMIAGALAKI